MSIRHTASPLALAIILAATSPQTQAAEREAAADMAAVDAVDSADAGSAIIITARRRNEKIQDVPVAANSYGGEQIEATRRSEEHTSELQSLMRISYAVFCLKKKNNIKKPHYHR